MLLLLMVRLPPHTIREPFLDNNSVARGAEQFDSGDGFGGKKDGIVDVPAVRRLSNTNRLQVGETLAVRLVGAKSGEANRTTSTFSDPQGCLARHPVIVLMADVKKLWYVFYVFLCKVSLRIKKKKNESPNRSSMYLWNLGKASLLSRAVVRSGGHSDAYIREYD